jgi:hypothetical protein
VAACLGIVGLACHGAAEDPFVYEFPAATEDAVVRYEVTAAGLSSVTVGDRKIAGGGWYAGDASWLYGQAVPEDEPTASSLEKLDANRVRVRHEGPALTSTFTYTFAGEDVAIHARVENFSDRTFRAVSFSGLTFKFQSKPSGYFHSDERGTLANSVQKGRGLHPCWGRELGGGYLADGEVGVGLSPGYRELIRTVFWWEAGTGLHYLVGQAIPPDGALAFEMTLRVSRNTDWKHLLEPYRAHFRKTFGPVRYHADHRPIGGFTMSTGYHLKQEGNPYGFAQRVDTPAGMRSFAEQTARDITRAGGQGFIGWGLSGCSPRGLHFRPDFDVLPPELEENLPIWRRLYQQADLKLGTLARPGEFPTPVSWTRDQIVRLSADDLPMAWEGHETPPLQLMINRFTNMKERGFRLFYLDTYGETYAAARTMRRFRDELGPDILTFAEFWSDVILVNTGAYMLFRGNAETGSYREFWGREHRWEIMRWLIPGVQAVAPCGQTTEKIAKDANPPGKLLYDRGITPLIWVGTSTARPIADEVRPLVSEFLDERGGWKHAERSETDGGRNE